MTSDCTDYDFSRIEAHWQKFWAANGTFRAPDCAAKPKYYLLDMFPYPSGSGLHAGHVENFAGSDVLGRYKLARGCNVLHPMGWDAFGLPAEQYAVKTGTHPEITTRANIETFRRQIKAIGLAIDWEREINTTDPGYFRWTQWIFLQLFRHGLAYVDERPVNWCPALGTVLANEEVSNGLSEVGGHPVERRKLRQWVLRITAYADRLLAGLDQLDWPESTKTMQRNWIGRSSGAEVQFAVAGVAEPLTVFTTRPDTLFGATYMVLAPEHPLVATITTPEQRAVVDAYTRAAAARSDLDRTDLARDKTGVCTGAYAINPVNGARIPIWIADYVLMSYGTGAIMAVPAHDTRDHAFAVKFALPIVRVIDERDAAGEPLPLPSTGDGPMTASATFDGLAGAAARAAVIAWLAERGRGRAAINYKLRDWLFSRQRYWGEPFPVVWADAAACQHARACGGPVAALLPDTPVTYAADGAVHYALPLPADALPLTLPPAAEYKPAGNGESPLATISDWVEIWFNAATGATLPRTAPRPAGADWFAARRETNTMPQWAGSCWYYLRYLDPHNTQAIVDPAIAGYWGVPDFYMGGAEHAVLHLLYARFWHMFLHDIGVVSEPEPFRKLFHQGIIMGEDGEKMSKSRGNVVNPDIYLASHGADSFRTYLMFMGPLEDAKPWNTHGIEGVHRFLRKVWREFIGRDGQPSAKLVDAGAEDPATLRLLHQTIRKVTEDLDNVRFNTAIAQMMIFMNHVGRVERLHHASARAFIQLLAPFAPHLAEELWARLGGAPSVAHAPWPAYDPALLTTDSVQIGLLVNGKPRGEALVAPDADEATVLALARANDKVAAHLAGKTIRKVVYVPGKILNLVVG
jgi:leucyl-tRNA synthetase